MGFKMTVRTTADGEVFTFPLNPGGGTVNCTIDWGDTTQDAITSYDDAALAHTYATAGDYDIEIISGTWTAPRFSADPTSALKVVDVKEWGTGYGSEWGYAFQGCETAIVTATGVFGVGVGDMRYMFYNAHSADPDTSDWDVSSAIYLIAMFHTAISAKPDTSGWDIISATSTASMFRNAALADPDVSGWGVSALTDAGSMFQSSGFSTANYEKLLATWPQQALQADVPFHAGSAKYRNVVGRGILTDDFNWTIIDGGADGDNLLDGFLWYGIDGKVYLGDGTTSVGLTVAPGEHKIGVAYGDGLMRLTVDGVDSAEVPYDGTLLDVTLDLFRGADSTHEGGRLQRYDAPFAEAKTLIDGLMAS